MLKQVVHIVTIFYIPVCFLLGNSPTGNYPKENIQHTEHGESWKSRILYTFIWVQNLVTHIKGKTQAGGVREWGAKEKA